MNESYERQIRLSNGAEKPDRLPCDKGSKRISQELAKQAKDLRIQTELI
jgi:hypothetical protein